MELYTVFNFATLSQNGQIHGFESLSIIFFERCQYKLSLQAL